MSKQLDVLDALKALVAAALTGADVRGLDNDAERPQRIPPNGLVILRDGDPGDATIDLCPPTYHYDHAVPAELFAYSTTTDLRVTLHDMADRIGQAVAADRFLGGRCHWLEVTALTIGNIADLGTPTQLAGEFSFVASYSTTNPLG